VKYYTENHRYYCGVDLHSKNMYLCVMDSDGKILIHRRIGNDPKYFLKLLHPFNDDLAVCCESTFNYYWLYDVCCTNNITFILAHALNVKAIHGAKTKNDKIDSEKLSRLLRAQLIPIAYSYPQEMRAARDLMRRRTHFVCSRAALIGHVKIVNMQYNLPSLKIDMRYPSKHEKVLKQFKFDENIHSSVKADLDLVCSYKTVISNLENKILEKAKAHKKTDLDILLSIKGVGKIISLTILYEINNINRFSSVQNFASYSRLVKCPHTSNGKKYGYGNAKMGNPYLKWIFSEMVISVPRYNPAIQKKLERLEKKYGKSKGKTILAHKLGRAVYYMLKNKEDFKEEKFLQT